MTGADVTAEARTWIGTRWEHQGRSDDAIDCAGLILKVAQALGIFTLEKADYPRMATDEMMLDLCREHLVEISRADLAPGDVVVMRYGSNRHIGIIGDYVHGGLTVIHAQTMHPRRVVENQFNDNWLGQVAASVAGCFRFKGLA